MPYRRKIVALEFDERINKNAIAFAGSISRETDNVIQLGTDVRPHVSLYHLMQRETSNVELLAQHLAKLVENVKSFDVRFMEIKEASPGWIFWNAELNAMLKKVHELVVTILAGCRDANIDIEDDWVMTDLQEQMFKKWGFPNVMAAYNPHITLAKVPPEQVSPAHTHGMPFVMTGTAERIVIYDAGPNGTSARVETVIKLQT